MTQSKITEAKQLSLDLDDEFEQVIGLMRKHNPLGSHSTWQIFYYQGKLFIGIRTHFYETDYNYLMQISLKTAEDLYRDPNIRVGNFLNAIESYKKLSST